MKQYFPDRITKPIPTRLDTSRLAIPKPGPKLEAPEGIKVFPDGREICRSVAAWQKRRLEVLRRDGYRCTKCKSNFRNLEVHHKKRRGMDSGKRDDRAENLITLCVFCHSGLHMKGHV